MKTLRNTKIKSEYFKGQIAGLPEGIKLSSKEHKGLKAIYKHAGKRKVFEWYLKLNPDMASKYLKFVSANLWVQYITWDRTRKVFTYI